jgi:hypothetical protein
MPYSSSDWTSWPSEAAWIDALPNRTQSAQTINASTGSGLDAVKQHLANGNLAVTRFDVYGTWYYNYPTDSTGIDSGVYYSHDGDPLGGHAVTLVGYDDGKSYVDHRDGLTHYGAFLIANSWGNSWGVQNSTASGDEGFFWVAYGMFLESTFGPSVYYNDDREDYRSSLYAVVGVNHPERWDVILQGAVVGSPTWQSYYPIAYDGGSALAVTDADRIAIDLTDGIASIPTDQPTSVYARLFVYPPSSFDATITSADFYEDFDGDGVYSVDASSDPTVTITKNTWGYAYAVIHDFSVTALAPSPTTVSSGGAASLSATYSDSDGHGVAWLWDDGGAGGSFAPSASVQSPTYTAPANTTDSSIIVTLTVSAVCDGAVPLNDSDSTALTVQPVVHVVTVTASAPSPDTVASGGSADLSATYADSRSGHSAASWLWDDGGAGGSFAPSASVQSPTYAAPANTTDSNIIVTLTVGATCDGSPAETDSDSTILTVEPVAHTLATYASVDPDTVGSGGTASLTANCTDSRGHGAASWAWDDSGAGGSFAPSAGVQNIGYTAPVNDGDTILPITLTVMATCDGPAALATSDSVDLSVTPAAVAPPSVLLEVHPDERAQGPGGAPRLGTAPWQPSGLGPGAWYEWKVYQFDGSENLWIQVSAQCFSRYQNAVGDTDRLEMRIDGQTPDDVWGIMSGVSGLYQWKGDTDSGKRLTLEFQPIGLSSGAHTLLFRANETPILWWVKVYDLSAPE